MVSSNFPKRIHNILFVCTGNFCRSVLGERLLRTMLAEISPEIKICSAGTDTLAGRKAPPQIERLLNRYGTNCTDHETKRLTAEMIRKADLIFVMENEHRKKVLSLVPGASEKTHLLCFFYSEREKLQLGSEIPDPIGMSDFFFENVSEMIKNACQNIADQIKNSKFKVVNN